MDNLAITTATFGTDSLVATGTEYYPHTSQAQVANNTGFNFYRPFMIATQDNPITGDSALLYKAYMAAGTYQAYAAAHVDLDAAGDSATIEVDGTTIVTEDGNPAVDDWINDDAEVIVSSSGYVDVGYTTVEATSATIDRSMVWVRQLS